MNKLTAKQNRAIQLRHKLKTDDLNTRLIEYHHLLDTLMYLNQALMDEKVMIKRWEELSDILLIKFWYHGLSLHRIWSGQPMASGYYESVGQLSFIDIPSAKAVLRSKLETFLMYHYIYVNSPEEETQELRYYSWVYTALLQRRQHLNGNLYTEEQKEKDTIEIEKLKNIIVQLPAYMHLTAKQQKSLIEVGSAKMFKHWDAIFQETGFEGENTFLRLYAMLCMYAHSEGLSAIQLSSAYKNPTYGKIQARYDCYHAMLLTCLVITSLAAKYPAVKSRLDSLPEQLRHDIEILSALAKATGPIQKNEEESSSNN